MNITIRYDTGRIDVFDTVSFTAPQPFPQTNMLTDFELKLDDLGKKGLWLAAHYYAIGQAYRDDAGNGEVPVARRRMGWRFLLAQEDEIDHIQSVDMDGSPVLRRAAGTLFDYARFENVASALLGNQPTALCQRIMALYGCFEQIHEAQGQSMDAADIAAEFGFTAQMIADVEACMVTGLDEDKDPEEEEVWEDQDESD